MRREAAAFLAAVSGALGGDRVVTDRDVLAGHTVDWTGRWRGSTPAVVRPTTVQHVEVLVELARRHRVPLVPQGGNTGLVGGATPLGGEVVVDLRGLDRLGPVEPDAAQVTAGAGATLGELQAHVRPSGLSFGVDLAARGTATIGGMVATNAGGLHVVRHGAMRSQLLGVQAVLGTGKRIDVNPRGLVKDNTGYDLAGLLCGSEGTLGIVTAVRLRLVPTPASRLVALLGLGSVNDAVAALPILRAVPSLTAVELMVDAGLAIVGRHLGTAVPVTGACALLVEVAGEPDGLAVELAVAVDRLGDVVLSTAVADEPSAVERLWRWREAHSEAAAALGLVHKADVTLPTTELAAFAGRVTGVVDAQAHGATTLVYGHLADGNLHVNVVGPPAEDGRAIDAVLDLVLELGGSVSAEHGVGVAKREWLVRQRGDAAVSAMRAIKASLDPDGILNPHVLLPDP